jgi:hypothetical protein
MFIMWEDGGANFFGAWDGKKFKTRYSRFHSVQLRSAMVLWLTHTLHVSVLW